MKATCRRGVLFNAILFRMYNSYEASYYDSYEY